MEEGRDGEVYSRFRRALEAGRLTAGAFVTQSQLCKALDVSVARLRRAIVLLEAYGLVSVEPRAGIRIAYPDVPFIRETYQFLMIIEVAALRALVGRPDKSWLADMRRRHEEMKAALKAEPGNERLFAETMRLDNDLHDTMIGALDNATVRRTHQLLRDNLGFARQVHRRIFYAAQYQNSLNEHLQILDAIERGDLEAAVAGIEAHFQASTHRIFGG